MAKCKENNLLVQDFETHIEQGKSVHLVLEIGLRIICIHSFFHTTFQENMCLEINRNEGKKYKASEAAPGEQKLTNTRVHEDIGKREVKMQRLLGEITTNNAY